MEYQIGPDFGSYSRRGNRRLVDYVTIDATQKTDKKITKMVFHLTEIALGYPPHMDFPPRCARLSHPIAVLRLVAIGADYSSSSRLVGLPNDNHCWNKLLAKLFLLPMNANRNYSGPLSKQQATRVPMEPCLNRTP